MGDGCRPNWSSDARATIDQCNRGHRHRPERGRSARSCRCVLRLRSAAVDATSSWWNCRPRHRLTSRPRLTPLRPGRPPTVASPGGSGRPRPAGVDADGLDRARAGRGRRRGVLVGRPSMSEPAPWGEACNSCRSRPGSASSPKNLPARQRARCPEMGLAPACAGRVSLERGARWFEHRLGLVRTPGRDTAGILADAAAEPDDGSRMYLVVWARPAGDFPTADWPYALEGADFVVAWPPRRPSSIMPTWCCRGRGSRAAGHHHQHPRVG